MYNRLFSKKLETVLSSKSVAIIWIIIIVTSTIFLNFGVGPRIHQVLLLLEAHSNIMYYLLYLSFFYEMFIMAVYTYAWNIFTGALKDSALAFVQEIEVSFH